MSRANKQERFTSEVDLAAAVAAWGESQGWDVYKEVHTREGDIDIVLVQGKLLWAIESKLTYGPAVLEQAYKRLTYAHYVSVAVPHRNEERHWILDDFAERNGIGVLEVRLPNSCRVHYESLGDGRVRSRSGDQYPIRWDSVVHEGVKAKVIRPSDLSVHGAHWGWDPQKRAAIEPTNLQRRTCIAKRITALRASLRPEHKALVAGAPGGGQLTPWKATLIDVKVYLAENGPSTIPEIMAGVHHHYGCPSAAKQGLYRMLVDFGKGAFTQVSKDGKPAWKLTEDAA